jgi:hypothetical protein
MASSWSWASGEEEAHWVNATLGLLAPKRMIHDTTYELRIDMKCKSVLLHQTFDVLVLFPMAYCCGTNGLYRNFDSKPHVNAVDTHAQQVLSVCLTGRSLFIKTNSGGSQNITIKHEILS